MHGRPIPFPLPSGVWPDSGTQDPGDDLFERKTSANECSYLSWWEKSRQWQSCKVLSSGECLSPCSSFLPNLSFPFASLRSVSTPANSQPCRNRAPPSRKMWVLVLHVRNLSTICCWLWYPTLLWISERTVFEMFERQWPKEGRFWKQHFWDLKTSCLLCVDPQLTKSLVRFWKACLPVSCRQAQNLIPLKFPLPNFCIWPFPTCPIAGEAQR